MEILDFLEKGDEFFLPNLSIDIVVIAMRKAGHDVCGFDYAPEMVEVAKRNVVAAGYDENIIFRDNISVPTIPALARARRHLDRSERKDVTLVITGGLRKPGDFIKALALGADAVAVSNAAMQASGHFGKLVLTV